MEIHSVFSTQVLSSRSTHERNLSQKRPWAKVSFRWILSDIHMVCQYPSCYVPVTSVSTNCIWGSCQHKSALHSYGVKFGGLDQALWIESEVITRKSQNSTYWHHHGHSRYDHNCQPLQATVSKRTLFLHWKLKLRRHSPIEDIQVDPDLVGTVDGTLRQS